MSACSLRSRRQLPVVQRTMTCNVRSFSECVLCHHVQGGQAAAADGSRFYALLVEVLKVEANVVLNDVLRPGADAETAAATNDGRQNGESDRPEAGGTRMGMQSSAAAAAPDLAGPSDSTVPAGVSMEVDETGPSQPAAGDAEGAVTAGMGVLPQPFQQPWTPEQQAERWAAAERAVAAAAASGSTMKQVLNLRCHARAMHL